MSITLASRTPSVGELPEYRIDAAVPLPMEQLELALGRGLVGVGVFDQRGQEDAFVGDVAILAREALQAGGGDLQRAMGQLDTARPAELHIQRMLRHAVAQRMRLRTP